MANRPANMVFLGLVVAVLTNAVLFVTPATASFPGQNGRIAFYTNVDAGNYEVYTMDADGTGRVNLTNEPLPDATPSWSADGTRIAFISNRFPAGLYVMNADGSNPTLVTSNCVTGFPAWNPDGTRIAFTSCGDDIYIVNVDGSGLTNLTNNAVNDAFPSWSPDGTRVAFARWDAGSSGGDIWVMDADGANAVNLTNNPTAVELQPDWSSDGSKIAYYRDADIFVMNADGSGATNLTMTAVPILETNPSWAPDGTRIAFAICREDGSRCDIWTMASDGSDRINLTGDVAGNVVSLWPDWQPLLSEATDALKLDVFWGPKQHRTLAYANDGTLTAGDFQVDPATGLPTAIGGTGTLPSSGSGDATITFDLALDPVSNKWFGTVVLNDPGAEFSATVPIHSWRFGITREGTTTRGVLWGFKAQSVPRKCFLFTFEIQESA